MTNIPDAIRRLASEEITAHDQPLVSMAIGAMTSALASIADGTPVDLSHLEEILNDLLPGGALRTELLAMTKRLPYAEGEGLVSAVNTATKAFDVIVAEGCERDSVIAIEAVAAMRHAMEQEGRG